METGPLTRFDLPHMQRLPLVPISVPPPGPAHGSQAVAKRISIPRCRGSNPAAPASQSGLHRAKGEVRSKPRDIEAFRRSGFVSVYGIWQ
jgi:hypothetical protein